MCNFSLVFGRAERGFVAYVLQADCVDYLARAQLLRGYVQGAVLLEPGSAADCSAVEVGFDAIAENGCPVEY